VTFTVAVGSAFGGWATTVTGALADVLAPLSSVTVSVTVYVPAAA
jgi:hypothetical protein